MSIPAPFAVETPAVYQRIESNNKYSDIIDTEHSSGDLNKMLLGSFNEEYDKDEDNELTIFNSPEPEQYSSERTVSPQSLQSESGPEFDPLNYSIQRSATDFSHSRNRSGSSPLPHR